MRETQKILEMTYATNDNVANAVTLIIITLGLSDELLELVG
jgi:hypothetical protein